MRLALESRLARRIAAKAATKGPDGAPAASHAGPASSGSSENRTNRILDAAEEEAGLRGHLVDAFQFLFHQHIPWLCLLTMLAFPVVIGLGGFLTSGSSAVALAAISALPGICVLAVICAMGRRVLVESSQGLIDAPAFPELKLLTMDALRFVRDIVIVGLALATPIAIGVAFELSWVGLTAFIVAGMIVAPMAFCLRQLRGGSASLSPFLLLHAVWKGGPGYFVVAIVCWLMVVPLAAVGWYVAGQPVWLQIATIGPTAVLPVILSMRLLGTWIDARHQQIGKLLAVKPRVERSARKVQASGTAQRRVRAPKQRAPARKPPAAPSPTTSPTTRPKPNLTPSPSHEQRIAESNARAAHAIEGRTPRASQPADAPDLSSLPGAVTVSGRDRVRSGAAARR